MSPSEVVSRVGDQLHLLKLRLQHKPPPAMLPQEPPGSERKPEFNVGQFALDTSAIAADYSSLLEGTLTYGGGDWQFDEGGDIWHVEHTTLRHWPQAFFNALDYRPGNPVGDARRTWEPARLQQLVALAVRTRDLELEEKDANSALALSLIERQLTSWWIHNPLLHGIHYVSAMECGLRCVALSHAASLLESRGRLKPNVRAIVLTTLQQHADFIRKRISSHSSAGNHTLAECAGLIYACLMLPDRAQSAHDEEFATDLFSRELDRQVNADGGGIEQATWYHRFNIELAECVAEALSANGRPVPYLLRDAIDRGGRFLKAVEAGGHDFLRFGDSDDGFALSRYYDGRWKSAVLRADTEHFEQTGVSCIRVRGWKVTVQYGPLGMAPSYGHGHADALSVLVSLDGQEILCDAGTGAYGGECAAQRAYFRSCAAHNTVQVGAGDFARALSPFMWSHPYTCDLLHQESNNERVEMWLALSVKAVDSFTVYRYVCVDEAGVKVADRVALGGTTNVAQRWHLSCGLVEGAERRRSVQCGNSNLIIELGSSDNGDIEQTTNQRSVRYGELQSVVTLANNASVTDTGWLFMQLVHDQGAPALNESLLSHRAAEHFE